MTDHNNVQSPLSGILLSGAKGVTVGIIAAAVLLFTFTGIAYSVKDPDSLTSILGYAALFLSAAIAGGTAGRLSGGSGGVSALAGAAAGAMLLFVVILLSFIPAEAPAEPLSPLVCMIMYAGVPAIAALMGSALRVRKKLRRHRRRR